jgi:hypothetical protein
VGLDSNVADCRRRLKHRYEHRTSFRIQPPIFWYEEQTALSLACGRSRFPVPAPRRAAYQGSELRYSPSGGLANSLGLCQRMADQAMTGATHGYISLESSLIDLRPLRPTEDALFSPVALGQVFGGL